MKEIAVINQDIPEKDKFERLLEELSKRPITDLGISNKEKRELFFGTYKILKKKKEAIKSLADSEIWKINKNIFEYILVSDIYFDRSSRNEYLQKKLFAKLLALNKCVLFL